MKLSTIIPAVIILITLFSCNDIEKYSWTSSRGNTENTGYKNVNAPFNLTNLKWKFKAEGAIWSTPAIFNGQVFFAV